MNDWRKPCEHGRYESHWSASLPTANPFCPGGSPITAADLEGLGETDWVCERPRDTYGVGTPFVDCQAQAEAAAAPDAIWRFRKAGHNKCGWRLLIPIPDPPPATSDDFTADMMARVDYGPDEDDDE